jgi:hypothetical protein
VKGKGEGDGVIMIKVHNVEGTNLIEVHYMHVWKYHNETSLYN